jgi:hypothetical protein
MGEVPLQTKRGPRVPKRDAVAALGLPYRVTSLMKTHPPGTLLQAYA